MNIEKLLNELKESGHYLDSEIEVVRSVLFSINDTHAIVPREPSGMIWEAGNRALTDSCNVLTIYKAMIKAAENE